MLEMIFFFFTPNQDLQVTHYREVLTLAPLDIVTTHMTQHVSKKRRTDELSDSDNFNTSDHEQEIKLNSIPYVANGSSNQSWQTTIEKVVQSVVSIHFCQVASFDTEDAVVSQATGFVVDSVNGYILTNRHVVGPGPFVGYAVFDNHEECDVKPIYRDPVHDFGVLQFEPKNIKYMKVSELTLRPDLAKVGCEIRVVGNDAGEKLSILSGFISRLDRNAPEYGSLTYNDFNTEYIQAAASATGGSSGSPVVDIDGYAVALQAGGSTESSTDFFFPVYRALRALRCIQNGEPISRGTIQVQWILRPFDECRRLGIRSDNEKTMRDKFPSIHGLLVAEVVLPEGPADGSLREGDTLISINGELVSSFVKVDEVLDSSVGQTVELVVDRNGKDLHFTIPVNDLHAITPARYLEVCGASFNDLSYQMARLYAIPVRGVFANRASGSFTLDTRDRCGWIIDSLDHKDTPDLDTFIEVLKSIPDCSRVQISFRHISDLHTIEESVVYIDRHWYSEFRLATRNDETGLWDFTNLQEKPLPPKPLRPLHAKFIDIPTEKPGCSKLGHSMVLVTAHFPLVMDGYKDNTSRGYGVIASAENGYVIISRKVVPHDLIEVFVTVAESIIVPAKVKFLHPLHNYAIVKYDPSLVEADVLTPNFSSNPLKRGDKVVFVGFNQNMRAVSDITKVSDIPVLNVPINPLSPRYRACNFEGIQVDSSVANPAPSGVLADEDGTIRALWLTYLGSVTDEGYDRVFGMGFDTSHINQIVSRCIANEGHLTDLRIIDSEFYALPVIQARLRGVPEAWIERVESRKDVERPQFFTVLRTSTPAIGMEASPLKVGDIVLSLNGHAVNKMADLDDMYTQTELQVEILRKKQIIKVTVPTVSTEKFNTSHLVYWSGALLQPPHQSVRQVMKNLPSSIYIMSRNQGSPATQYGLNSTQFVTHVNEQETPDLEAFINVVRGIPDNTYCKLRLVSFDNIPSALTLKTNYHYFPTSVIRKDEAEDKWIEIDFTKDGPVRLELN